ncbi:MAG: GTPase [Flavobacteriales bacterium]|jgi:hypothetical protein
MESIIFVYNANSDIVNSAIDFAHKIIQPSSYKCNLCKLTHGNFKEKNSWKTFRKNKKATLLFYHIDEFEVIYPKAKSYPIVFKNSNNGLLELISTEVLNKITKTEELIYLVENNIYY